MRLPALQTKKKKTITKDTFWETHKFPVLLKNINQKQAKFLCSSGVTTFYVKSTLSMINFFVFFYRLYFGNQHKTWAKFVLENAMI